MERLVGQTLDRYKLTRLLGQGGMGAVFKATDLTLQRDVAIKVINADVAEDATFQERLLQEARTAARLDHPSIVQVYDFSQEGPLLYIVMEFIPGANLRHMLEEMRSEKRWIKLSEAVAIVRHIALAIDYAHRQDVVHRDLKPSNIMIEPEPSQGLPYRPVLTDLGLAQLVEGDTIARDSVSMGTPIYLSPEEARGEDIDARSDVYALGVMLYELSVGAPPFQAKTFTEATHYHTQEAPRPPGELHPHLPEALERVILRALKKDPDERWQRASDLAEALVSIEDEVSSVTDPPPSIETTVSLLVEYQRSLTDPRGPSIFEGFDTPLGTGDVIQARLPDGSHAEFEVTDRSLTLGRADDNDIVLPSDNVSRHHARIELSGGTYQVVDLDSTNGTYIGDTRVPPDVHQAWRSDQPLRLGDVWLRLVRETSVTPAPPSISRQETAEATDVDLSTARSSAGEGRVGVVMEKMQHQVMPGEETIASLVLLNQGTTGDHFSVVVDGIPATWVELPPPVQLMPGEEREVEIVLHPPRRPQSKAGRHAFFVRVVSRERPSQSVEVRAALTIATFSEFNSRLHPQRFHSGEPAQLSIENDGNFPDTFTITANDRGRNLEFEVPADQIKIPAGETAETDVRARPRRRPVVGESRVYPFVINVTSSADEVAHHTGELVGQALIPVWALPIIFILLAIACGALIFLLMRPPVIEAIDVVPANPVAGEPVTIRWRVNNAQRVILRPFDIEVDPDAGQYTFSEGFREPQEITLVAANAFQTRRETLPIRVDMPVIDPIIEAWTVFPTEITQGQEVTIRWHVTNAESVRVQPFGNVESQGEQVDTPQESETYTLLATNQGRLIERSQRVVVMTPAPDAPQITTFAVEPATVTAGEDDTVQITWETMGADAVTIEPDLGPVGLTGSRDVPVPTSDTVYTLVAQGPGGETRAQVQVVVEEPQCLISGGDAALRSGPGSAYDPPLFSLPGGTAVRPLAYSAMGFPDGQWVRVRVTGMGDEGWVNTGSLTECNVNVADLGSAPLPPTPVPTPAPTLPVFTVTNVVVNVEPTAHTGQCPARFEFVAQITTTGAGPVTYRWERSDGTATPVTTLSFDGAGTQTVTTDWTVGAEGAYWQQLHVLEPNDLLSEQGTFTLECTAVVAYIYNNDLALAESYEDLLEMQGFDVTLLQMSIILSTAFEDYSLILVGPDTGAAPSWGDDAGTQANAVAATDAPILGLGEGGYAFFGRLGLPIGWENGWQASGTDIYVVDVDDAIWNYPEDIVVPNDRTLSIYTSDTTFVAIDVPDPIVAVTPIGRQVGDDSHYPIIGQDDVYLLWGWDAGPEAMTVTGQQAFINATWRNLEREESAPTLQP